jgi:hypothetical protein
MRVVLVFSKDVAATYAASEAGSIGSPRWPMTFEAAKRAVGVMVLLLTLVLLLTPVPLSNIAPTWTRGSIWAARPLSKTRPRNLCRWPSAPRRGAAFYCDARH